LTGKWALPVRAIHWATALLAAVMIPCAYAAQALTESDTERAETLVGIHIAAGLSILVLTVARLAARLALPSPLPADDRGWPRLATGIVSALFYTLLVALPLTGILKLTLSGLDVSALGMAIVPAGDIAPQAARIAKTAHEWLGKIFIALALVHAAAALLHRRFFGTTVLQRMT
jgi:cytochrome b561